MIGKKIYIVGLLLFFLIAGKPTQCFAQDVNYKSYTLFLYNFMKYIEWPGNNSATDFIIGIYSDGPIKQELEALAQSKKIKGRKLVIRVITSPEEAILCHLIYIPASKAYLVKKLEELSKKNAILIVCERDGAAKRGADISFMTDDNDALKFEINKSKLDARDFRVAQVLLEVGMIVK